MDDDSALTARLAVVDPVRARMMGRHPTTFSVDVLPFYRRFRLLRAFIALPHQDLVLSYADSGAEIVPLTGEPADVYRLNAAEGLRLTEAQLGPYLRFFLKHTAGSPLPHRQAVEEAGELEWLARTEGDPSSKAAREAASAEVRPIRATRVDGGYRVLVTVWSNLILAELTLRVDDAGRVTEEAVRVLREDLPVVEATTD
jgi:hypothetical protein